MSHQIELEKWKVKDGELSAENMKRKLDRLGYKCTQYTFLPGMNFPDHAHGISKKDAIICGKFRIGIYGREVVMEPGDILDIPKDTVHNATVIGDQQVVFFDSTEKAPFS